MIVKPYAFLSAALLLAACATAPSQASRAAEAPAERYTIEQLMAVDSFGCLCFSPDNEEILFTSLRTGIGNLYVMPVSGGEARALTHSEKETVSAIGYFPEDERILFTSDQGGDERNHIYVLEPGGAQTDVTPGTGHVARWVGWAEDGQSFYLVTNERDPRYFDLYEYSAEDYSRRLMFKNERAYQVEDVSPGRRYVGLTRIHDNARIDAVLHDTQTGENTILSQSAGHAGGGRFVLFSPDGSDVLYPTMEGREFVALRRRNLVTGEDEMVLAADWDVSSASFSPEGRYLVVNVNENARNRPYVLDAQTYERVDLGLRDFHPEASIGVEFANNAAPLAIVTVTDGDTPQEVYLQDLETGERRLILTALPDTVDQADLVDGEVIRFASYDGVQVPGILYIPKGAEKSGDWPAVIDVHGGPGGESRVGYNPQAQYLVNHGYVVFEINNRGSSGNGKTFYHLDDHAHGDADLDDVVAAKKMLAETGYADPDKVAIMGGSYGGYMTLAALTFRPEVFAAGVDIYGVSNWPRLLESTPAWWADLRRLLTTEVGDPETEEAYLKSISPYFHADEIERPLLVLQGANDPRVLQEESDDIVAKVRANDVPVEYVVFPDEGHGFRKKANKIEANRTIRQFLDRYVKNAEGGAAP